MLVFACFASRGGEKRLFSLRGGGVGVGGVNQECGEGSFSLFFHTKESHKKQRDFFPPLAFLLTSPYLKLAAGLWRLTREEEVKEGKG